MIITIPGEPVAKGRPRFTKTGRAYSPKKTANYEKLVQYHIKAQGGKQAKGPIKATIKVFKSVPKSWSKIRKQQALDGEILPAVRPDLDNYIKAILDAANGLLFEDDNQVVDLVAYKRYAKMPYVELEIAEL